MRDLPQLLDLIASFSKENPFPASPNALYEPCAYILTLGGKRLRPALTLMGYELFEDNAENALPAAWAVELFHNFSLMHDDIMDAAPLRRGQPTVHHRWNTTTAILSGDVMLIYAYRFWRRQQIQRPCRNCSRFLTAWPLRYVKGNKWMWILRHKTA